MVCICKRYYIVCTRIIMLISSRIAATDTTDGQEQQLILRINGVLPHITKIGTQERSERAAEVMRMGKNVNTSCSVFAKRFDRGNIITYHLLFDIGEGIIRSVEAGISQLGLEDSLSIRALELK